MTVERNLAQVLRYDLAQLLGNSGSSTRLIKNQNKQTNVRDKFEFKNSAKRLIFDLARILLNRSLIFMHCLIAEVIHYQSVSSELKLSK